MGVRFRLQPEGAVNDMVLHVKLLDTNNRLQQEAIGILGVNMIYACFYFNDDPEKMVVSLLDNIKDRVSIDLLRIQGQDFEYFDKRLLSLYLVKNKLSSVAMFDTSRNCIHPSEFLYKKSLMVVRGNFRPPTIVTQDVILSSFRQFCEDVEERPENLHLMMELTLDLLKGHQDVIDEQDFLDRSDMLAALGYNVLISDCANHEILINYLKDYKISRLGLVIGVRELREIILEKYTNNQDGRLLMALGELFNQNIKIYIYPAASDTGQTIITAENLELPEGIQYLYKYLLTSGQIVAVRNYNPDMLHIYPQQVWQDIKDGGTAWTSAVPAEIIPVIKEKFSQK